MLMAPWRAGDVDAVSKPARMSVAASLGENRDCERVVVLGLTLSKESSLSRRTSVEDATNSRVNDGGDTSQLDGHISRLPDDSFPVRGEYETLSSTCTGPCRHQISIRYPHPPDQPLIDGF